YICDRMNDRIQVFTMDGEYKRCINPGLIMPSALASFGETLVVAELSARLVLLDINDQIIDLIGDGRADYVELEGWPNRLRDGCPVWPEDLVDGKFNSPHGLTADPSGNIYVFEWLIKGRYIKLQLK
ncbi:MAG: hypothetical protein HRT89_02100, partial [Lentisphaeria bacterium]|nr:hypothetical protein [Lentisphaeria bacterium]